MQITGRTLLDAGNQKAQRAWAAMPSPRAFLLLWLPAILAAAAVLLPAVYLLIRAADGGDAAWITLQRPQTLATLGRTAWLAFSVTLVCLLLALPIAWLTVRTDLPLRRLWAVLTPLPLVIPSYVGAFLYATALGPRGLVQGWLEEPFGITRLPDIYGFPGALLVLSLLNYPYMLLVLRVALQRMDASQEEAARSLGHNAWSAFWRVTFAQLRPAIASGSLLVALYVLRDFGAVAVMRYTTFTRAIYIQYQSALDRSAAAVLALMLILFSLIVLLLESRARGRIHQLGSATGGRKPARVSLGRWRWPAAIFCGLVVFLALLLPAGVLVYWLVRGWLAGQVVGDLGQVTWNSVWASGLGAAAVTLAALPVAYLLVRRPGRASGLIGSVTNLAFALPGIVIALALVFFGANYALPLYQTLPMLVLAYLILFLPQAVVTLRSSFLRIPPQLEEAARGLGKGPLAVLRRVTLPLLAPGISGAAALVFLTAMKELPTTLLLAPIGFKTLATNVWTMVNEAFFARAAAPALLLILTSSLPMALMVLREEKES
ncbi:MAG: iron ABC transporter permease [Anaerolineales bacterium]|nr:iron ABC transporter permease [Anaerolineales bacterium]